MTTATASTSVDADEVDYYDRLAERWWDLDGPFWPLHRLNRLRSVWLGDRLCALLSRDADAAQPLAGVELLDVGCGGGLLSEAMARLGARVHAVDVVERNIGVARAHAAATGLDVTYERVTVEELVTRQRCYDAVLSMEVVEHVADLAGFVGACTALVRPGGALAVATLNRTFRSWLCAIIGAEYVLGWLPRGTHRWSRFVTPVELERLLSAGECRVLERHGVRVNPFTRGFSLGSSLAVNYMVLAERSP